MILRGLEQGYCEYDGQLIKQPRVAASARAVQVLPRPHLRRRGVARVDADHGGARRRHPHHPAEAVGGRSPASWTPYRHHLPRGERRPTHRPRSRPVGPSATRTPTAPARWPYATSAATGRPCCATTSSPATTSRAPRGTSTTARCSEMVAAKYGTDAVTDFFVNLQVLGHARAVPREDPRHPRAHRATSHLRRRLQLRRHAVRRGRAQHAALRARGDAEAAEAPALRRREQRSRIRGAPGQRRPPRLVTNAALGLSPAKPRLDQRPLRPAKCGTNRPEADECRLIVREQRLLVVRDGGLPAARRAGSSGARRADEPAALDTIGPYSALRLLAEIGPT